MSTKLSYKQLKEENKILGNIINTLKCSKAELEKENEKLKLEIDQIATQQTRIISENDALRNIAVEMQNKLKSNSMGHRKSGDEDLLSFLKTTTKRINNIENNNMINSKINRENEIYCLKQEIHKLEMDKLDLLKHNQSFVIQLQEIVNDQQSLQQKLCYLENENNGLRQKNLIENPQFIDRFDNNDCNDNKDKRNIDLSLSNFEDIIFEIKRLEQENKCRKDLRSQLFSYNEEIQKLKEQLITKQNENQSLFEKYSVTLNQYKLLCESMVTSSSKK